MSDGEDNAELVYDNDPRCWHDVDNGDGFGRPVVIFVASRMLMLTWPFPL